jgi:hypothetical protein
LRQQQQQQQQQHISWSPSVQPSAAAATAAGMSPSHAAMLRARQVRHSRNSSSCSDATLQLEQQLLGVFATGSVSDGTKQGSMGGSSAAAAAAAAGGDTILRQQQQQWETEEQEAVTAGWDGQGDSRHQQLASFAATSPAAAAASDGPAGACHPASCSRQSTSANCPPSRGRVILHFGFWLHELNPCDPRELKTPLPGSQNPAEQQQRNKLLLQLTAGLYTLLPQPQTPNPVEVPLLSPMASGEDWVGAEGFDSLMRLGLAGRQLSGQMATVAQQQQLHRWV